MYVYVCTFSAATALYIYVYISQVNHLSHFLLTLELLPIILETASATGDGRIIFVASSVHTRAIWNPANINADQVYLRTKFYPNSKLYNVRGLISL